MSDYAVSLVFVTKTKSIDAKPVSYSSKNYTVPKTRAIQKGTTNIFNIIVWPFNRLA